VDTLKQVNPDRVVIDTLERNSVWRIQTPQAFPREMLEKAHQEALFANVQSTDDAALCERLGYEVVIVSGSEKAMKITTEEDFSRAEALSIWSG
jgi:2-C-methyl-D-erythritol 4-phosphate cytidylyltransferase